jgi:type IV secretion system protein VirB6
VALIGYRMLLGFPLGAREAVLATLRAGVIVAFCTSWPSYEAVVYRVTVEGPIEVAAAITHDIDLPLLSLPRSAERLQAAYDTIQRQIAAESPPEATNGVASQSSPASSVPPATKPAEHPPLNTAGFLLLASTIGGLGAVRLAAGVLLALGPLFIVLALFDSLIGLFEGWVRALAATFVSGAGVMIVVSLELAFIEDEVAQSLTRPDSLNLAGQELMFIAALFTLAIIAVLVAGVLVGRSFRLPRGGQAALKKGLSKAAESTPSGARNPELVGAPPAGRRSWPEPQPRAEAIADAVLSMGRRERQSEPPGGPTLSPAAARFPHGFSPDPRPSAGAAFQAVPLGYSLRRHWTPSQVGSTARRDTRR